MRSEVKPGDKVLYCPTGDWNRGRPIEAVVIEILGSGAGLREGNIKIRLADEDWRMRIGGRSFIEPVLCGLIRCVIADPVLLLTY